MVGDAHPTKATRIWVALREFRQTTEDQSTEIEYFSVLWSSVVSYLGTAFGCDVFSLVKAHAKHVLYCNIRHSVLESDPFKITAKKKGTYEAHRNLSWLFRPGHQRPR